MKTNGMGEQMSEILKGTLRGGGPSASAGYALSHPVAGMEIPGLMATFSKNFNAA